MTGTVISRIGPLHVTNGYPTDARIRISDRKGQVLDASSLLAG